MMAPPSRVAVITFSCGVPFVGFPRQPRLVGPQSVSSNASASVMATEDRMTEVMAKKATTNDPANASFFWPY